MTLLTRNALRGGIIPVGGNDRATTFGQTRETVVTKVPDPRGASDCVTAANGPLCGTSKETKSREGVLPVSLRGGPTMVS